MRLRGRTLLDLSAAHDNEVQRQVRARRRKALVEEPLPYALLVRSGEGELEGRPIAAGDAFLVTQQRAAIPYRVRHTRKERLEVFTLFPPRP